MPVRVISKSQQGRGAFNGGQIIENKPIGFPRDGGFVRPFGNLFYWARAEAVVDSTIGLHPHKGFEIMTFVLDGRIRHFDTAYNTWKPLEAGDVQIIRAGSGIEHAEHLEKGAVIFQIWTDPDLSKTLQKDASYNDYRADAFHVETGESGTVTTYVGHGSPLTLDTDPIGIWRAVLSGNQEHRVADHQVSAIYIIEGNGTVGGETVRKDDFVIVEGENDLVIKAHDTLDCFVINTASQVGYKTYAQRMTHAG